MQAESALEVAAFQHVLAQLGLGGDVASAGAVEHVHELLQVKVQCFADDKGFAGRHQASRIDIIVQGLHGVGGSDFTGADDRATHSAKYRVDACRDSVGCTE